SRDGCTRLNTRSLNASNSSQSPKFLDRYLLDAIEHQRAKARKQAEAEAAARPKRRRFFGLLPL
ncbi:MAG TPA: hypothetical protein VG479_04730, partial [Gaiellaceae bacterium]|nr:hypothetical protein [Gaiellaceae bacterium]